MKESRVWLDAARSFSLYLCLTVAKDLSLSFAEAGRVDPLVAVEAGEAALVPGPPGGAHQFGQIDVLVAPGADLCPSPLWPRGLWRVGRVGRRPPGSQIGLGLVVHAAPPTRSTACRNADNVIRAETSRAGPEAVSLGTKVLPVAGGAKHVAVVFRQAARVEELLAVAWKRNEQKWSRVNGSGHCQTHRRRSTTCASSSQGPASPRQSKRCQSNGDKCQASEREIEDDKIDNLANSKKKVEGYLVFEHCDLNY